MGFLPYATDFTLIELENLSHYLFELRGVACGSLMTSYQIVY